MDGHLADQGAAYLKSWGTPLRQVGEWAQRALKFRRTRRLQVRETLSLGEKRFLAVIEFDQQEFLVGGSGNSFALLARLNEGRLVTEPPLPPLCHIA